MAKYTIQQIIAKEVISFLKPLTDAKDDPMQLLKILRAAGIDEYFMKELYSKINEVKNLLDDLHVKIDELDYLVNHNDSEYMAIHILKLDEKLYAVLQVLRQLRQFADDNSTAIPEYIKNEIKSVAIADLFDILLVYHLEKNRFILFRALVLLRIIKPTDISKEVTLSSTDPVPTNKIKTEPNQLLRNNAVRRTKFDRMTVDWDALGDLFSHPRKYFIDAFKLKKETTGAYTENDLNAIKDRLFPPLAHFFSTLGLYSFYGAPDENPSSPVEKNLERTLTAVSRTPILEDIQGFSIAIMKSEDADSANHDGFSIWLYFIGTDVTENGVIDFDDTTLTYKLNINNIVALSKTKIVQIGAGPNSVLKASLEYKPKQEPDSGVFIGNPKSSFLYIPDYKIKAFLEADPNKNDIGASVEIDKALFVLKPFADDGLLSKIIPNEGIYGMVNIEIGLSKYRGLYLNGSGAMVTEIPINKSFLGVDVYSLYLALLLEEGKIDLITALTFSVDIGLFKLMVRRMGISSRFRLPKAGFGFDKDNDKDDDKHTGGFDFDFKWPDGLGIDLNWPSLRGRGFIGFDKITGKYEGLIDIKLFDKINVKAVASLITKMPDGSKGFSLVVIIISEGFKPIPLGLGFNLVSIGGILGKDRTMSLAALRDGVRNGALESLFLEGDIYKNYSKIIANIDKFFPPSDGRYLIGPLGKIEWGTQKLFTINLGVIIELPSPVRVAVPGVLKAILPKEGSTALTLQVNFLGFIDFGADFISFDASLYDSKLLHYTLTGDMAFRLKWGSNPFFLATVGGFHPAYSPPPLGLPKLRRLRIELSNSSDKQVFLESYFAITSNSVQFGAFLYAYFEVSELSVEGYALFDALFLFSPFSFTVHFEIGVSVRFHEREVLTAMVGLTLSGPTPWRAQGSLTIHIKLLVFKLKIRASFDLVFGDGVAAPVQTIPHATVLKDIFGQTPDFIGQGKWESDNNTLQKLLVNIVEDTLADKLLVHPDGIVQFTQNVMPLNMVIDKFGNARPDDFNKLNFTVTNTGIISTPSYEFFAMGEFKNMAEQDKLDASRSFQLAQNGFGLGNPALTFEHYTQKPIAFEVSTIDNGLATENIGIALPRDAAFERMRDCAIAKSPLSQTHKTPRLDNALDITATDYQFYVADANTLDNLGGTLMFNSITEAQQYLNTYLASNPAQANNAAIVNTHS